MKKILLLMAIVAITIGANAQEKDATKADVKKTELKEHVCTTNCAADAHVYACGEKGHECVAACKEKAHADIKKGHASHAKKHVCTDACKEDAHAYACGEKGHTCSAECKKK
ncbi:MAG: hypothetical protein PF517_10890 [Salinivirgaceae bacterium]|jgi:hypothetical protein|nr:hypothetical protein [Salinivirgaceae bacterium]